MRKHRSHNPGPPRRPDDAEAFLPEPSTGHVHTRDILAETLAEEYIASATSAEEALEDLRNAIVPEEIGGPFIESSAAGEFADTVDDTNPEDAEKEPFPTANHPPR
jgi:hypothetical protein